MKSFLRSERGRKKNRRLGSVAVVDREEFEGMELDSKVEMIRGLIPLGLMHVQELLAQEVELLAEARCQLSPERCQYISPDRLPL